MTSDDIWPDETLCDDEAGEDWPEDWQDDARYRFAERLARGGMGEILAVEDQSLRREVVLKRLLAESRARSSRSQRFIREAQITAQLAHPNIVPVYELGERDGSPFFTMKRVTGESLGELIRRLLQDPQAARELTLARRLQVLLQIAQAVAFAHSRGVVHRDLKPENVMLGEFGEVLVMDWGLAKFLGEEELPASPEEPGVEDATSSRSGSRIAVEAFDSLARTREGQVLGTPLYMSPEQARGDIESVDARSDIYSLGGLLTALLCLRPPYDPAPMGLLLPRVGAGQAWLPGDREGDPLVPAELRAIAAKAMELLPEDRYPDVGAFIRDLQAYLDGFSVSAHHDSLPRMLAKWLRRNRSAALALAAGLTALVFGGAAMFLSQEQRRQRRADALLQQGDAGLAAGDFDAARDAYAQTLGLRPEDRRALAGVERAIAEAEAAERRAEARATWDELQRARARAEAVAEEERGLAAAGAEADEEARTRARRAWYEARSQALDLARKLRGFEGAEATAAALVVEESRRLARRLREDESFDMAETMIDEAARAGLAEPLVAAERGAIAEARSRADREAVAEAREVLDEAERLDRVSEERFQGLLARLLRRPHPELVRMLIARLRPTRHPVSWIIAPEGSSRAVVQRLAVTALGELGEARARARVLVAPRWCWLPGDAPWAGAAVYKKTLEPTTTALYRLLRERWLISEATSAVELDAPQAIALTLTEWAAQLDEHPHFDEPPHWNYYADAEVGLALAVTARALKDGRMALPLALARRCSGVGSALWELTEGWAAELDEPALIPDGPAGARLRAWDLSDRGRLDEAEVLLRGAGLAAEDLACELALLALRRGDAAAALAHLEDTGGLRVGWLRAEAELRRGDAEAARSAAIAALALAPEHGRYLSVHARALAALGDPGADAALDLALTVEPRRPSTLKARAERARARGDPMAAFLDTSTLLALPIPLAERRAALRLRADLALEAERPQVALDDLDELLRLDPADARARLLRARARLAAIRLSSIGREERMMVTRRVQQDLDVAIAGGGGVRAEALYESALLGLDRLPGNSEIQEIFDTARRQVAEAIALDPQLRYRRLQAELLRVGGHSREALRASEAIPPTQRDASDEVLRAELLADLGRPAEALAALEAARAAAPTEGGWVLSLGRNLRLVRGEAAALAEMRSLCEDASPPVAARASLWLALHGAPEEARSRLDAALALDPAMPRAWEASASQRLEAGEPARALDEARHGLSLAPLRWPLRGRLRLIIERAQEALRPPESE